MSFSLFALVSRFGAVGVAATLTYLAIANLLIAVGQVPTTSSLIGYLAGMAVSFLGQSRFTFRVARVQQRHVVRFCALSVIGLLLSFVTVWIAAKAGLPPAAGTVATAVLIPLISFVVMKIWVFQ